MCFPPDRIYRLNRSRNMARIMRWLHRRCPILLFCTTSWDNLRRRDRFSSARWSSGRVIQHSARSIQMSHRHLQISRCSTSSLVGTATVAHFSSVRWPYKKRHWARITRMSRLFETCCKVSIKKAEGFSDIQILIRYFQCTLRAASAHYFNT